MQDLSLLREEDLARRLQTLSEELEEIEEEKVESDEEPEAELPGKE